MADQSFAFLVTTPPGTLQSAPQVTQLPMPSRTVKQVEIIIPPGPNGQLGVAVGMNSQQVIPSASNTFLVASDYKNTWDTTTTLNSGAWECISYNTGLYPHTVQFIFHTDLIDNTDPLAGVVALDPGDITDAVPSDQTDTGS